jgi:hypothetical protein
MLGMMPMGDARAGMLRVSDVGDGRGGIGVVGVWPGTDHPAPSSMSAR